MTSSSHQTFSIASVDDDPKFQVHLSALLDHLGLQLVYRAGNIDQAVAEVGQARPDAILLDVWIDGVNELKSIPRLRKACDVPIVVVSLQEEDEYRERALELGAADYVRKARVAEDLGGVLQRILGA